MGGRRRTGRAAPRRPQLRRRGRLPALGRPTLDLIGYDLGVPRFPPLPYAFEDGTVALYHLDDAAGRGGGRREVTLRRDRPSRHGRRPARAGAPGRFGTAVAFATPAREIARPADHPELRSRRRASPSSASSSRTDGDWAGTVLSKHPTRRAPDRRRLAARDRRVRPRRRAATCASWSATAPRERGAVRRPVAAAGPVQPPRRRGRPDRAARCGCCVDGVLRASAAPGLRGATNTAAGQDRPDRGDPAAAFARRGRRGAAVAGARDRRSTRCSARPTTATGAGCGSSSAGRCPPRARIADALNDAVGPVAGRGPARSWSTTGTAPWPPASWRSPWPPGRSAPATRSTRRAGGGSRWPRPLGCRPTTRRSTRSCRCRRPTAGSAPPARRRRPG